MRRQSLTMMSAEGLISWLGWMSIQVEQDVCYKLYKKPSIYEYIPGTITVLYSYLEIIHIVHSCMKKVKTKTGDGKQSTQRTLVTSKIEK